jgi:hypothetical protein
MNWDSKWEKFAESENIVKWEICFKWEKIMKWEKCVIQEKVVKWEKLRQGKYCELGKVLN